MTTKRVFITDLAAYNEGILSGRWVELPTDPDELAETIQDVLKQGWEDAQAEGLCCCEKHEEYFITDYEGFNDNLNEYVNLEKLNSELWEYEELAMNYNEDIINIIMENIGYTLEETAGLLNAGVYLVYNDVKNEGDVAYKSCCEYDCMEIPDHLKGYIDWDKMGNDMFINGCWAYDWSKGIAIEIFN